MKNTFLVIFLISIYSMLNAQNVEFSASVTKGCSPLTVTFTDSTVGASLWEWDFGNGNSSTIATNQPRIAVYTVPGYYTAKLTINGNATDSVIIHVIDDPDLSFSVNQTSGCPPLNVEFNDMSTSNASEVSGWFWDFGNGTNSSDQNASMEYENSGNYNIFYQVTDTNGCQSDTLITSFINVDASPTAGFVGTNLVACTAPLTADFNAAASQGDGTLSYTWDFGDGNTGIGQTPSHTYTTEGTYDVSLIVQDDSGCPDTLELEGFVGVESMNAGFEISVDGCGPATVTFSDTSSPSPNSWNWTFVGGNIGSSTAQNPTVVYPVSGSYQVSLTAENAAGCSDNIQEFIVIDPPPSAFFVADQTYSCSTPFAVTFSDFSTGATEWLWDFGDGNTSMDQNPLHNYRNSGVYSITLTVTNKDGCTNSLTRANYITVVEPVAGFETDVVEGCINLDVAFTDLSTSNENIVGWEWDFGDGNTSIQQNPNHTYTTEGEFDIQLVIVNALGCRDTLLSRSYIQAGQVPTVDFEANLQVTCADTFIQFTNNSTGGTSWEWMFGDGGQSSNEDPIHIYVDTGYFDVQLIVNNYGCEDSLTKARYIDILPPIALFIPSFSCGSPYNFDFDDVSIDAQSWSWDFGDGKTSNTAGDVSHSYDSMGVYVVTLQVTNAGCTDEASQTVLVAEPIAGFESDTTVGCVPLTIAFTDTSAGAEGWEWWFSDGGSTVGEEPSYTFTAPGFYAVNLAITAANGCVDTITRANYIEVLGPAVSFQVNNLNGCLPHTTTFTDLTVATDGILSQTWYFGDGDTSNIAAPSHEYDSAAIYTVGLAVTDNNNCRVRVDLPNAVSVGKPVAEIYGGDFGECPTYDIQFINRSNAGPTGSPLSYVWDFGDGNTSTDINPLYAYATADSVTLTLFAESADGCRDTATATGLIKFPEIGVQASDSNEACPPFPVMFTALSDVAGGSYNWDFGDGGVSTITNPSHTYAYAGTFDVSLTFTTNSGCVVTQQEPQFITLDGPVGTFTFTPNDDCAPLPITFTVTAQNTISYEYVFGDGEGMVTDSAEVVHTYEVGDTIVPRIILRDDAGCAYTMPDFDTVKVSNIPISIPNDSVICPGDNVTLSVVSSGSNAVQEITWTASDTTELSKGLTSSISHTPMQTTKYTVRVEDVVGCVVRKDVWISLDSIVAEFASTGYCPGDSALLNVDTSASNGLGGRLSFQWTPSTNLSNDTIFNPFANPTSPRDYTLTISDSLGCSSDLEVTVSPYTNPTVSLDPPNIEICYGEFGSFDGSGTSSYEWQPSIGLSSTNVDAPTIDAKAIADNSPIPDGAGLKIYDYMLIGTDDSTGCRDTFNTYVMVRVLPEFEQPSDTAFCNGDSVSLTVQGDDSYIWFPYSSLSDSAGQTVTATPALDESYQIIGVDDYGCKDTSDWVLIEVHDLPEVNFISGDTILVGMEVNLSNLAGDGGHTYRWEDNLFLDNPNISTPTSLPDESITYVVFVNTKTSPSCLVTDTVDIIVYDEVIMVLPDAFTPNGDTDNDVIYAYAKGMEEVELSIYGRWGQLVFQTDDLSIGWDGTYMNNGKPVPMDTYSYVMKGKDLLGNPQLQKGQITILK